MWVNMGFAIMLLPTEVQRLVEAWQFFDVLFGICERGRLSPPGSAPAPVVYKSGVD